MLKSFTFHSDWKYLYKWTTCCSEYNIKGETLVKVLIMATIIYEQEQAPFHILFINRNPCQGVNDGHNNIITDASFYSYSFSNSFLDH